MTDKPELEWCNETAPCAVATALRAQRDEAVGNLNRSRAVTDAVAELNGLLRVKLAEAQAQRDEAVAALRAVKNEGDRNHNTRCRAWWPVVTAALAKLDPKP